MIGDAIYVLASATTVGFGSCGGQTLTKQYDGVKFYYDDPECDDSVYNAACTIFATGTLSGKYEIIDKVGGCCLVCATCP